MTLLMYILIVGLVAVMMFLLASVIFGRSEELGPLPEDTTATVLPAQGVTGADVRALRFQQVVRGYKAAEVDWALARLAGRIDELETEVTRLRQWQAAVAASAAPAAGTQQP
ncbi:DivIVA domain-containing protein [Nocardia thailandica]|uniref:DivIVA domain-containing protein n=1 Tax=Nocardia thailandica TaxID=257275 RepID=UPI0002EF4178|nr:DivIVA domain-containing protein [Nocardia thailandica]